MRQKVVIIGHGYTSRLGIIRSLGEMDCEITVIAVVPRGCLGRWRHLDFGKPVDCYSRYVSRVIYCRTFDEEGLIDTIVTQCGDDGQRVVVIPDSDWSAATVDKYQERLKGGFVFPHIRHTAGLVEHWMDKTHQKQLAEEVGLNVAHGQIVDVSGGHYTMPSSVDYPCFTKALATISGGKQFLCRCDDEQQLRAVLDNVATRFETRVLVEDYKTIDKEYAVVGFSDGEHVVMPGVIEFIANSQSHFGIAREGRIGPVEGFERLMKSFADYVLRIGFCGLFDIDFYESGSEMYFGEINLRFGGSGYAYTAMGVNLPAMLVKSFMGEPIDDMQQVITGTATYANERMIYDDYLKGYITRGQCRQIIESADISFISDNRDRGPQRKMRFELGVMVLRRQWIKLKKK